MQKLISRRSEQEDLGPPCLKVKHSSTMTHNYVTKRFALTGEKIAVVPYSIISRGFAAAIILALHLVIGIFYTVYEEI